MKGGWYPLRRWEAPEVQHWQERRRDKRDRKEQKKSKALSSELLLHNSLHRFLKKTTNQCKPLLCLERVVPQPGHNIFPEWEEVQIIAGTKRCRLLLNVA